MSKSAEILQADCGLDRLNDDIRIRVAVSGNILKNGMGVGIPGTGMTGLHIAAALGAVCGRSDYGLEVLGDMDEASLARAKVLVQDKATEISIADTKHKLYVKAEVCAGERSASTVIEDSHDNIVPSCCPNIFRPPGSSARSSLFYTFYTPLAIVSPLFAPPGLAAAKGRCVPVFRQR